MKQIQDGFTVVEIVLGVILIGIISFTGYRVFTANQKANDTLDESAGVADQQIVQNPDKDSEQSTKQSEASPEAKVENGVFKSRHGFSFKVPNDWELLSATIEEYESIEAAVVESANHFSLFFDDPETNGPGFEIGGNDLKVEFFVKKSSGETATELISESKVGSGYVKDADYFVFNNVDAVGVERNDVWGDSGVEIYRLVSVASAGFDFHISVFGDNSSPRFSQIDDIVDSLKIY